MSERRRLPECDGKVYLCPRVQGMSTNLAFCVTAAVVNVSMFFAMTLTTLRLKIVYMDVFSVCIVFFLPLLKTNYYCTVLSSVNVD